MMLLGRRPAGGLTSLKVDQAVIDVFDTGSRTYARGSRCGDLYARNRGAVESESRRVRQNRQDRCPGLRPCMPKGRRATLRAPRLGSARIRSRVPSTCAPREIWRRNSAVPKSVSLFRPSMILTPTNLVMESLRRLRSLSGPYRQRGCLRGSTAEAPWHSRCSWPSHGAEPQRPDGGRGSLHWDAIEARAGIPI